MRKIAIASLLILAGCVPYASVHQTENKTSFHLNDDYQAAYRIINEGMIICVPSAWIQSAIYPDQKTARVTQSFGDTTAFTVDLSDDGSGGTNAEFYTTYNKQKQRMTLFKAWVNEGKHGCSQQQLR